MLRKSRSPRAIVTLVLVVLLGGLGASYYVSELVADGALRPNHQPDRFELIVVESDGSSVRLRSIGDTNWLLDGTWALDWRTETSSGWAVVGTPSSRDQGTRQSERPLLSGEPPPPGAEARLDNYVFLGTPSDFGLSYREVAWAAYGGESSGWLVCEGSPRWMIYFHGKGGDPREVLRMLPTVSSLGLTTFAVRYSNDLGAPPTESGRYEYGASEGRDVDAAVQYAKAQGAREIILAGHSMGGAIVTSYLLEPFRDPDVRGAILDSPMLDLRRTLSLGLRENGIGGIVQTPPLWLVALRFDISWSALNFVERSDDLETPTLLLHGTGDNITPISASDEFAHRRPDLVTYERIQGAHHAGAWNVAQEEYERAVRDWLTRKLGPRKTESQCNDGT